MGLPDLLAALADVLLPPVCPLCREDPPRGQRLPLCETCWTSFEPLREPFCSRCSLPFPGTGPSHDCPRCRRRSPPFARARAWGAYDGGLLDALQRLKYRGDLALRSALERLAVDTFQRFWEGDRDFSAVVCVPPDPRTLGRRGFDLPALLSRAVARSAGLPWNPAALLRRSDGVELVGLDAGERWRAAHRAYDFRERLNGRVLLVDDVLTTTATARACALACRRAGARSVDVLALARTPLGRTS